MRLPTTGDTILALATAWQPSALAIIRLSGPDCFEVLAGLGIARPDEPGSKPIRTSASLALVPEALPLPADLFWFRAPRSYTGQNLVEIHTLGALPWVRALTARLLELGARRAWPGEFTARAYLNGKLAPEQLEGVLGLISATDAATARSAARQLRGDVQTRESALADRLLDLLARVEAGIDFAEEEDVRFISPDELCSELAALRTELTGLARQPTPIRARPHVALAGLPNAGKSTLFNKLVGFERAIVSPVLGTTRDVLSADVSVGGVELVLQDCAGLGRTPDELELAAHRVAERAADQADLVLWVHAADVAWTDDEARALARISAERVLLIISKSELPPAGGAPPDPLMRRVEVSAATGAGLAELQHSLAAALEQARPVTDPWGAVDYPAASAALERTLELIQPAAALGQPLAHAELVAVELHAALDALTGGTRPPPVEDLLGRIFSRFCIGK